MDAKPYNNSDFRLTETFLSYQALRNNSLENNLVSVTNKAQKLDPKKTKAIEKLIVANNTAPALALEKIASENLNNLNMIVKVIDHNNTSNKTLNKIFTDSSEPNETNKLFIHIALINKYSISNNLLKKCYNWLETLEFNQHEQIPIGGVKFKDCADLVNFAYFSIIFHNNADISLQKEILKKLGGNDFITKVISQADYSYSPRLFDIILEKISKETEMDSEDPSYLGEVLKEFTHSPNKINKFAELNNIEQSPKRSGEFMSAFNDSPIILVAFSNKQQWGESPTKVAEYFQSTNSDHLLQFLEKTLIMGDLRNTGKFLKEVLTRILHKL